MDQDQASIHHYGQLPNRTSGASVFPPRPSVTPEAFLASLK